MHPWHAVGRYVPAWSQAALDLLIPPACPQCGREVPSTRSLLMCAACCRRIVSPMRDTCFRCGLLLPPGHTQATTARCPSCRGKSYRFDGVLPVLGTYRSDLRRVVVRMKQAQERELVWGVGRLWAQQLIGKLPSSLRLITPIPRHWWRRLQTRQDVPFQLAECLAQHVPQLTAHPLLRVRKWAKKQSRLARTERIRNQRGLMMVRPGIDLRGCTVGVVDDIMTTGATLNEAARALRAAGADRIYVLVVARARPDPLSDLVP